MRSSSMKIMAILIISLIGINCDCSGLIQSLCNADAACNWVLDPSNLTCQQTVSSCLRYDDPECDTIKGCVFNRNTLNCEFKSQCPDLSSDQCKADSNCIYQGVGHCVAKKKEEEFQDTKSETHSSILNIFIAMIILCVSYM